MKEGTVSAGACQVANPAGFSDQFSALREEFELICYEARCIREGLKSKVDDLVGPEDVDETSYRTGQFGPDLFGRLQGDISNIKDTLDHIKHHLDRL